MKAKKYLIVGPPGAGKSTLLSWLPSYGICTVVDLENIGGKENYALPTAQQHERNKRVQFLEILEKTDFKHPLFVGCADLDPNPLVTRFEIIFLFHSDKEQYLSWVEKRNLARGDKRGQSEEINYGHMLNFRARQKHKFEFEPARFKGNPGKLASAVWQEIDPKLLHRWPTRPS
ncbi:hypothetical protein DES53_110126 [Roseimicrobium gellanilyticum]|uniref:AAA domain-containing protein n=1 Tax=Roseimicrobium gellanilyticum TaxID=748857 RepID=A0A366HA15_9BACT|nr:hypothetical protein [Roseimicrobium gellanilyticum]RBP39102.1 hypothetical protein DES53_110126 [Roseimicrobium gellanilyticum]